MMTNQNLPAFIRKDVERAIEDALHPKGMSTHDGKARIGVDRLQYLLRMIDGPRNADVLEFLRSFIAGGSQQDFKPWASELYQKLYRASDEASAPHEHDWRPTAPDARCSICHALASETGDSAADSYRVQCTCGWHGTTNQLRSVLGAKGEAKICPECSKEFRHVGYL